MREVGGGNPLLFYFFQEIVAIATICFLEEKSKDWELETDLACEDTPLNYILKSLPR